MAIHYTTDGQKKEVHPLHGDAFTLDELREFVGGYIEIVQLETAQGTKPDPQALSLVVNEEFQILHLPLNKEATFVYRSAFITQDWIAGNALLATNKELGE